MWTHPHRHPPGLPRRLPRPALASLWGRTERPAGSKGVCVCPPSHAPPACLSPPLRWAPCASVGGETGLLGCGCGVEPHPHVPHVDSPPRPAQIRRLPHPALPSALASMLWGRKRPAGSKGVCAPSHAPPACLSLPCAGPPPVVRWAVLWCGTPCCNVDTPPPRPAQTPHPPYHPGFYGAERGALCSV
eukprot:gene12891-biopygen3963